MVAIDVKGSRTRAEDRRLGWVAAGVAFVLLAMILLGAPASARATDNSIDFSSPTVMPGDMVTTQYASQGVTFGQSPLGASQPQPLYVESSALAPSPANVALQECSNEICSLSQWIEFSSEVNHVSMSVAAAHTFSASVTLTAYDSNGIEIAGAGGSDSQAVSSSSLSSLSVSAADTATTIAFVQVTATDGNEGEGFEFADLSYGPVSATPTADFGLVNPGATGGVVVDAGGTASTTLILRRYGGSSGPIDFSYSLPPSDLSASVTPTPDSDSDGSNVTVTFTATAAAPAVTQYPVTITGTPESPSVGNTQHSIIVLVTVVTPQSSYGLRIQGLELTQGIQTFTLPTPAAGSRAVPYSGVKLVAGMPAVVRVFADAPNAPLGSPSSPNAPGNGFVPGVTVQLAGVDSAGQPLPGSPLVAAMPPLSDTLSATVPLAERLNSRSGYDFTLPSGWLFDAESKPITLTATLTPPPESFTNPVAAVPCTDPACVALRTFTLSGISSLNVGVTRIFTIFMENGGVTPDLGQWDSDVAWVDRLIPAGLEVSTLPYGTIDIDWIVNGCYKGKVLGHVCYSRSAKDGEARSEVEDFAHHQLKGVVNDQPIIGVSNPNAAGQGGDLGVEGGNIGQGEASAVIDVNRPLTDVAHEIGHMFGLVHASKSCGGGTGGNTGQPWPPDQQGYIDGIGLNMAAPVPPSPSTFGPSYPVVGGPPPGDAGTNKQQFYDFLSYCANPGSNPDPSPNSDVNPSVDPNPADGALGNSDAWISVRNWDYIATEAACFNAAAGSHSVYEGCHAQADSAQGADSNAAAGQQANEASVQPSAETAEAAGPGMMSVYGYIAPEGANIAVVDPTPSTQPLTGSASPISLELQGAHGQLLAKAPLLVTDTHVDPDGKSPGGPLVLFEGAVRERAGASAISVMSEGSVLATDKKPAHVPRLTLLAPRAKQRVTGTRPLVVRWHATNPDHVHLVVSIDFSTNNGRTWRTMYVGENTGKLALARAYLSPSRSARIRVRVNDGFDQVSATSNRFTILKLQPKRRPQIHTPKPKAKRQR